MLFLQTYIPCAGGIVLSILIPVLSKTVRDTFGPPRKPAMLGERAGFFNFAWQHIEPYVKLGLFSLCVALLIVAVSGDTLKTWQAALIAGYLWDSTLQKIMGRS